MIVDVAGYYQAGSGNGFHPIDPGRVMDSRPASQVGPYSTPWPSAGTRNVTVGGLVTVPTTADSAVLNVTVTDTTGASYLTVWPAGQARPTASNLNWKAGETIPNAVTVRAGGRGAASVFNFAGTANVIVDVAGWFG